ncbi:hypothetical protein Tco_0175062, partial [Tanacetum coccineum]
MKGLGGEGGQQWGRRSAVGKKSPGRTSPERRSPGRSGEGDGWMVDDNVQGTAEKLYDSLRYDHLILLRYVTAVQKNSNVSRVGLIALDISADNGHTHRQIVRMVVSYYRIC